MGGKDFSMKGGDPLTGFIYTSDLVRAFASRVIRSAEPVGFVVIVTASSRFREKQQFSERIVANESIVISIISCF